MRRNEEPTHLRLVRPVKEEEVETLFAAAPEPYREAVQRFHLPFSKETLWLRMLPCTCGGVKLYYVKIVPIENLRDHKPYLWVDRDHGEEIVLSKHVEYKFIHKLFRLNPRNLVLHHIFKLQRRLLKRDVGLRMSLDTKAFFDREFGLSPRGHGLDIHPH